MPRIILASQSPARKKILKAIGLDFSVVPAKVKEETRLRKGCQELVVTNACKKAQAVAERLKKGIVIAADTVVFAKGCLIGKPDNIKDAERTIRLLCRDPHWVYSGLAVIDVGSKRCYTAWDKTKVYMSRLSRRQINDYCRKFLPFDKAGSFDIQGPGALFVERIEGCYYNVVGLPLAKLVKILNRLGIDVFRR